MNTAYTLPSDSILQNGLKTEIKDALVSFSSANDSDGVLKNVHCSGVKSHIANEIKNASVPRGNTFTINNISSLSSTLIDIITNKKLTNVFEYVKPTLQPSKRNNYYNYDPTRSMIKTTKGSKSISNLESGDVLISEENRFTFSE